jgi:hypothetical protein
MPSQLRTATTTRPRQHIDDAEIDLLIQMGSSTRRRDPEAAQAQASAEPPSANNDAAPIPTSRNDLFRSYAAYQQAIAAAAAKQSAFEQKLFGLTLTHGPASDDILDVANMAIDLMIAEASKQFSTRYTNLSIDKNDVLEAAGQGGWRDRYVEARRQRRRDDTAALPPIPVDLDAIWAQLEKTYGGQAGQHAMFRQLAPLLIKRLHLNDGIKQTAKHVVAHINVRSDQATWGLKDGRFKIYSTERSYVNEVIDGLSHAFKWAGLVELGKGLEPGRHKIGDWEFVYESRETFSFDGLDIVTYKDTWDIKMTHTTAEKLRLFLGEFGT